MRNSQIPQVFDSRNELLKDNAGFFLLKMTLFDNIIKKLSIFKKLSNKEKVSLGLDDLICDRVTS